MRLRSGKTWACFPGRERFSSRFATAVKNKLKGKQLLAVTVGTSEKWKKREVCFLLIGCEERSGGKGDRAND
jgi:hypothetical protein